jgi:hypothetical protein
VRPIVDRFQLSVGAVRFWVPYWINREAAPYRLNAPYRGKGTPGQLASALARYAQGSGATTAEDWRRLMRQHGLGIDCSGFVYYVLDQLLQQRYRQRLASHLMLRRLEVLEALERRPERKIATPPESLPEVMPLGEACALWHKDPVNLTNVQRLVDPLVVEAVPSLLEVVPGDLIKTWYKGEDHIAVVVEANSRQIVYADSGDRANGGLGGVAYGIINITNPALGLEAQDWERRHHYNPAGGRRDGLWRLGALQGK